MSKLTIPFFIDKDKEGTYFTVPFNMPPNTETFTLSCEYEHRATIPVELENYKFISRPEQNVIDLGLIGPDGRQVGASGSNKRELTLSETDATPGYTPGPLTPGEWKIIVGAYHVAPKGVNITYHLTFTPKHLRLLKGDLHTHTLASDGVVTVDELARRALRHHLDFLAITDHNTMIPASALPRLPGLTLINGIEWTHYQGHANFLGVDQPYDEPYMTNDQEGMITRFQSARERGALITVNHPFEESCPFKIDLKSIPFDCMEIWNGPMRESNFKSVGLWHSLLVSGMKIPISAGSDYHSDALFIFPGGPSLCVYALSAGVKDILEAIKLGHAYATFAPNGSILECTAGSAMLGDSVPFAKVKEMRISIERLAPGDVIRVVTAQGAKAMFKTTAPGNWEGSYKMEAPGFARVEVLRSFLPGLPQLPALISNPIYFDKEED